MDLLSIQIKCARCRQPVGYVFKYLGMIPNLYCASCEPAERRLQEQLDADAQEYRERFNQCVAGPEKIER